MLLYHSPLKAQLAQLRVSFAGSLPCSRNGLKNLTGFIHVCHAYAVCKY